MTGIIRLTIAALGLAAGAACVINPSSGNSDVASMPRLQVSQVPSPPSGQSATSVWVLSNVGLHVRNAADPNSQVVATLTQGAQLTIEGRQANGNQTWLQVKSQTGSVEGWVLDDPDLVIHRSISLHVEQSPGWSLYYPSEWSPAGGNNPATFTGPSTTASGGSLLVQWSDDPAKLSATPMQAGKEVRQEGNIVVYGHTTYLTVYQLDGGGYEFDVKTQFPKTKAAYLFDFKQPASGQGDTTLFKQILDTVNIPGEGGG